MTGKEARLVLRDSGLRSIIQCTRESQSYIPEGAAHLRRVELALRSLRRMVIKISKQK